LQNMTAILKAVSCIAAANLGLGLLFRVLGRLC